MTESCPVCRDALAGLNFLARQVHVNSCLEGVGARNPTPPLAAPAAAVAPAEARRRRRPGELPVGREAKLRRLKAIDKQLIKLAEERDLIMSSLDETGAAGHAAASQFGVVPVAQPPPSRPPTPSPPRRNPSSHRDGQEWDNRMLGPDTEAAVAALFSQPGSSSGSPPPRNPPLSSLSAAGGGGGGGNGQRGAAGRPPLADGRGSGRPSLWGLASGGLLPGDVETQGSSDGGGSDCSRAGGGDRGGSSGGGGGGRGGTDDGMPAYEGMSTQELKGIMASYGLKQRPARVTIVSKLQEMWIALHPAAAPSGDGASDSSSGHDCSSRSDGPPVRLMRAGGTWSDDRQQQQPCQRPEGGGGSGSSGHQAPMATTTAAASVLGAAATAAARRKAQSPQNAAAARGADAEAAIRSILHNFFWTRPHLHQGMLLFQSIDVGHALRLLHDSGVKCSRLQLARYFDDCGVTCTKARA
ncbi:unnamed protein product [Phaeothamnion confervicola]